MLDTARGIYCRIVEALEAKVAAFAEAHGLPMRVGYNASRGYHVQMTLSGGNKKDQGTSGDKLKVTDLPATFVRPQIVRNTVSFTTVEIATLDRKSQDCLRDISVMSNAILTELLSHLRSTIGSLYR